MNGRAVGQNPSRRTTDSDAVVDTYSATPMMTLMPADVSQSRGSGSKQRTSTTRYQIR
jgi:hypothetical protein